MHGMYICIYSNYICAHMCACIFCSVLVLLTFFTFLLISVKGRHDDLMTLGSPHVCTDLLTRLMDWFRDWRWCPAPLVRKSDTSPHWNGRRKNVDSLSKLCGNSCQQPLSRLKMFHSWSSYCGRGHEKTGPDQWQPARGQKCKSIYIISVSSL